ncbi:isochorismate synthase MenF [Paraliobacillus quinghaiensis]|uniref:isochorismate synthase n=1 Tax=Paraliobacillus quinghaiensis TaxID=470815 RepID=A0A917TT68_9BACI|nr:isochorismate synthase [Paraliobacillus quinghaiensis]GGM37027.1 isochorismate synthase MenF [Paraliobacillus quinghaiensis]
MIETQQKQLGQLLEDAIERAKINKAVQVLSITEKIDPVDPHVFFEQAKYLEKDRSFWASVPDDFYLVGAGVTFSMHADENYYQSTEKQWKQLLQNAMIHNEYQQAGTGPIAIGAFPFDYTSCQTALWEKFSGSHFTVPTYLLTKNKEDFYLTINLKITDKDEKFRLQEEIEEQKRQLIAPQQIEQVMPIMKDKLESSPEKWMELVKLATEQISQGTPSKIVIARKMEVVFEQQPVIFSVLKELTTNQTLSFVFAIEKDKDCFIGATPERLVRIDKQQLFSTCLAGTAPRGKTKAEDDQIGQRLWKDTKNREEHDYVVRMIKGSLERYCDAIDIPNEPVIYPLKNLQHLYTPVVANLKSGFSIFDVVKDLHPTPALGGLPREASLSFIREHESLDRGWYGAPIGWLDAYSNGEFAVAIRSALITEEKATLFAGCGVVKSSEPEAEYEETMVKFTPMLTALGGL